jgi:hypothetical protein
VNKLSKDKGITIYFEENNLDAFVENLQNKGIQFTALP